MAFRSYFRRFYAIPNTLTYQKGRLAKFQKPIWTVSREIQTSRFSQAIVDFKLADIGEGIAEVEILQWFVKEGEEISQFDPLCSVQSDKATVEITSRYDGIVKTLEWKEGEMAKVGSTLVKIETEQDEEKVDHQLVEEEEEEKTEQTEKFDRQARFMKGQRSYSMEPVLTPMHSGEFVVEETEEKPKEKNLPKRILTTPAVRRLAKEHDINLLEVRGTGKDGRILKEDMLDYISSDDRKEQVSSESVSVSTSVSPQEKRDEEEDEVLELKGIRKMMFKTMTKSLEVPHFNYMDEYNVTKLIEYREAVGKDQFSFLSFFIKTMSIGMNNYPILNSILINDDTKILVKKSHDFGIAMDTPRGLLVPVIRGCDRMTLKEISEEVLRLQKLGQENKLGEKELGQATFTISNIGAIGGTYMSPVVSVPQVGIVAIGRMRDILKKENEDIVSNQVINFSFAADHRIIDGATVARFSNLVKDIIENPKSILLHLK